MLCSRDCKGYEKYVDIHHHGQSSICLNHMAKLTAEELDDFIYNRICDNVHTLLLGTQSNLNNEHLKILSELPCSKRIKYLNLSNTEVTYDGISYLWNSKNVGSIWTDSPIYDNYYNLPLSIVEVDITNTPAIQQYLKYKNQDKHIFPLPFKGNFEIKQGGSDKIKTGLKQIVLINDDKKIS